MKSHRFWGAVFAAILPASTLWAADPGSKLTWAPPALNDPVAIEISNDNHLLKLDKTKDYILKMPSSALTAAGGLIISGGRNVVLIGGEIRFDSVEGERKNLDTRAVYINGATGTVHIEGLLIAGELLQEGFNIDMREPGSALQLQNIRVDTVHGTRDGHHADVVQTWAGPPVLRIDRMTGSTTYQGFFLHPMQFLKKPFDKDIVFDLRRINIYGASGSGYIYWQATPFIIRITDVWAELAVERGRGLVLWPKGDPVWKDVQFGLPPEGDFVPASAVGLGYVSPGYLEAPAAER